MMNILDIEKAVELKREGKTYLEICSIMGINKTVISEEVRKYNKKHQEQHK